MLSQIRSQFRKWREIRHTIQQLERLDSRQLSDIGLSRGEILFAARNGR